MARILSSCLALLPLACNAWSAVGAQTSALVAQEFLTPEAASQCQRVLGDPSLNFLANAATWAANYSLTPAGAFTIPYHKLPARDNPPSDCNTLLARDCPRGGCLATAISNYTAMLGDHDNTLAERATALRMLIALVSDNTEPPNIDQVNGTGIPVLWQGRGTSLYDVWNHGMPTAIAGGDSLRNATAWANYLINHIKAADIFPLKTTWLQDLSLCWPGYMSMTWAADANAYMCNSVIPNGAAALVGKELSGEYFANNTAVIHRQIAKGGYRLAALLNLILIGEPGLAVPDNADVPMCNTTALPTSGSS